MPIIFSRAYSTIAFKTLIFNGFHPTTARIYASRDVSSKSDLDSSFSQLHSHTSMLNAQKAAKLLYTSIKTQKQILIIADFDADGATACAVGIRGLRQLGGQVDYIVPNRFEYGYGLTPEIVRLAAQHAPDILLTVDNGIASVEGVAEANRLGMKVLITDHHLPGNELPDAACIVNPNQRGCEFPSKNLAGVGVMFYVLLALRAEMRNHGEFEARPEPNLASLLDLVALGTIADVVKLDQTNRILVKQGLERIKSDRACAGIQSLVAVAGKSIANLSAQDLGFSLGPRLNAAGRLSDMRLGIECLLTENIIRAREIAEELDDLNRERRTIEQGMRDSAFTLLQALENHENFDPAPQSKSISNVRRFFSITMYDATWHQGVIGILASRLKDKFHRPTIIFADAGNNELKGSGRSIPGFHLRDAIDLVSKRHPLLIRKFGGHAAAAGLTIHSSSLDDFGAELEQVASEQLSETDLSIRIETDGELEDSELTMEFAEQLDAQVWGQGFPAPLFQATFEVIDQRVVGEKHLKLKLALRHKVYDAILFNQYEPLPDKLQAAYSLDINEYNGRRNLQLILRHWETAGG
jgi:single-stranded-DNA-specific exonuclease